MLPLRKNEPGPEELFALNYERLLRWSLQLTGGDRPAAEDLLHDVFVLFSLHRPEPAAIENLDGYLYTMLRNLHVSQLRRQTRAPMQQLSIMEFDSAEAGLRALGAADRVQVQDELRRVCRYACARKERAKAACALILRFFHGYYPSEVALVLRTSRPAVDVRLREARGEARLFLEDPRALAHIEGLNVEASFREKSAWPTDDLLHELRQTIFRSRRGDCFTARRLARLYGPSPEAAPAQDNLAHLVSCADCLDEVNRLLGLPPLSERHPADSVTREPRGKGGGGTGPGGEGGAGGGLSPRKLKRLRRSAGEAFEHKPQELCVSVNGHLRGAQRVTSERSELNLIIDSSEHLNFVEVFSEQDVRLLMLPVTAPPAGDGEQSAAVSLSDGRRLEVSLRFRGPWPALRLYYRDPTFNEAAEPVTAAPRPATTPAPAGQTADAAAEVAGRAGRASLGARLASFTRGLFSRQFLLRPGTVTAALALILVTTLILVRMPGPAVVSAAEILRRSAAAEELVGGSVDVVLHRTLSLEEHRAAEGESAARRRIEIWKSAARGVTVRRVFDERGRLLAGEWRGADGASTVYRTPDSRRQGAAGAAAAWDIDSVWRLEPSAGDYAALVGRAERVKVEERGDIYLLRYEAESGAAAEGLVAATLVVRRDDLRATEQTLVVRRAGGEQTRLRFAEVGYERRAPDSVAPSVFEPEAELLSGGGIRVESPAGRPKADGPAEPPSDGQSSAQPAVPSASTALEVEVLGLLNQAGADLGEQVSVARTPQGGLHVRAIVETEERKAELLRALRPVAGNPSVRVEVATASEAARQSRQVGRLEGPEVVQQVEPADNRIAADADLRRYFAERGAAGGDQLETGIIRFAMRASARSRQALQHAWALKRLAQRFTPEELRTLDAEAKRKWLAMIRDHAEAARRETAALRQELQPVFAPQGAPSPGPSEGAGVSEAELLASAGRLLESCTELDAAVRPAFAVSTGPSAAQAIKSQQFWRRLAEAESLAGQIRRAAQRLAPPRDAKPNPGPRPAVAHAAPATRRAAPPRAGVRA
jgi:RNA polymerase sigma factor (sigma-70 family)